MEIRRGTEADLEALQRLWDAFTAEATFTPYPGIGFDTSLVTTYTALVAAEDRDVLGTAYLNNGNEHFGFVFGVYVVPEARRRGVARHLMQEAARVVRDSGRAYVVLGVDTPNGAARALYAKLGFEDTARTLRAPVERLL